MDVPAPASIAGDVELLRNTNGIRIRGLRKHYGRAADPIVAIRDLDLDIEHGSVVAVTGPSGSGKSTLLRLVGALEASDGGSIVCGGTDLTSLSRRAATLHRRSVGFVFQRFHLLPALSALDNVIAPVLPRRTDYDKTPRANQLLADVGLGHRAGAFPAQLSGGEQQRVAIARALMGSPRVLLADEPTGSLDTVNSSQVVDLLLSVREKFSVTILIATHEREVADRCDRVVALRDGELVSDVLRRA